MSLVNDLDVNSLYWQQFGRFNRKTGKINPVIIEFTPESFSLNVPSKSAVNLDQALARSKREPVYIDFKTEGEQDGSNT